MMLLLTGVFQYCFNYVIFDCVSNVFINHTLDITNIKIFIHCHLIRDIMVYVNKDNNVSFKTTPNHFNWAVKFDSQIS